MSHQIASELRWPRLGENRSLWFSQVIAEITKDGALALVASATITEADPEPDADDASKAAADSDGKSTDAAVAEAEVASEQSAIVPSAELTQALDQMADSALGSLGEGAVDELEASLIGLGTVTAELVETYGEPAEAGGGAADEGKDIEALVAELDAEGAALA